MHPPKHKLQPVALAIAALALLAQITWILFGGQSEVANLGATVVIAVLALSQARWRAWNTVTRIVLGLMFAGSVADRLGWFGKPGQDSVTWGAWEPFVEYTRNLVPSVLDAAAPFLAVSATVIEGGLAVLLILGVGGRLIAGATAVLLVVFGTFMLTSVGFAEMTSYAVPVMAAGAAVLATSDTSWRLDRRLWGQISPVDNQNSGVNGPRTPAK